MTQIFVIHGGDAFNSHEEYLADLRSSVAHLERMKPGVEVCNYSDYPQMNIRETAETIYKCLLRNVPKLNIPWKSGR